MPTLVTLTSQARHVTRLLARTLREDGWVEFQGPVQLRFFHPAVHGIRAAKHRLYSIRLDPQLFLVEDHADDEWADERVAGALSLRIERGLLGEERDGIATISEPTWTRWTPEEDALLFELTNAEVARRTGRTISAVKARRSLLRWRRPTS